jgi:acyl-coenzyme A synthetase/AMP-(fatty) acid ligase
VNLADWSDRIAIIWQGRPTRYADLLELVTEWNCLLDQGGITPGQTVAIDGDYSPRAVSLLLALIARRAIAIPLTRSVAAHRTEFLEVAEAQWAVSLDDRDRFAITPLRETPPRNPLLRQLADSGGPGLILFTSGSTGKSKAALHDLDALLEKFQVRRHSMCTLTFLVLDHIGGINTLFYTLANGGTVVSVQTREPDAVCAAIAAHRVELLPTTPSFLNLLLLSEAHTRHDLSSLKRVTYGTEVMPATTLQRVREVLPRVELQQTYGLTEVGILRSRSKEPGSLLVKVGGEGYETKVVDGILWIRARSAMLGYLNAPSPFDADGWFNTQDAVIEEGEYIRILGRNTEIINVGGQKVYPTEIENVILQLPGVKDATVFGEPNPLLGQVVSARLVMDSDESPGDLRKRLRIFCAGRLAAYKIPVRVEISHQDPYNARFKKLR